MAYLRQKLHAKAGRFMTAEDENIILHVVLLHRKPGERITGISFPASRIKALHFRLFVPEAGS